MGRSPTRACGPFRVCAAFLPTRGRSPGCCGPLARRGAPPARRQWRGGNACASLWASPLRASKRAEAAAPTRDRDVTRYDRTVEDIGNVVALEHVNTRVPDQQLATIFYATGLGLTRDPYLMTGVGNMWMNVGRSQFHLPTGKAQVLRGHTGLVMPNRAALLRRLGGVKQALEGT